MKYCVLLLLFLSGKRLNGEEVKLHSSGGTDGHLEFHVPREELEKVHWNPSDGTRAPLTRDQAIVIAQKAAVEGKLLMLSPPRLTVQLETINPSYLPKGKDRPIRGCTWFYLVTFMDDQKERIGYRGTFAVTMSGTLATREITPST